MSSTSLGACERFSDPSWWVSSLVRLRLGYRSRVYRQSGIVLKSCSAGLVGGGGYDPEQGSNWSGFLFTSCV